MSMASTIQPYANQKNAPLKVSAMGGLGLGDELMLKMEDASLNKQRAQMAATAGTPKSAFGPMTLSALGSFFG